MANFALTLDIPLGLFTQDKHKSLSLTLHFNAVKTQGLHLECTEEEAGFKPF